MTDKPQPDKFDWATELSDAQGRVTLSEQEAHEIGARLRSLGAKLKAYEDLGDAADDMASAAAQGFRDGVGHVQNPAENEHVAGDVSKNEAELNMSAQQEVQEPVAHVLVPYYTVEEVFDASLTPQPAPAPLNLNCKSTQFDWATELSDAQGHVTLSEQEAKEIGARLRSMGAKLKVYEYLGDAADDVQLLRMGYEAARLEIESLRAAQPAGARQPDTAYADLMQAASDWICECVENGTPGAMIWAIRLQSAAQKLRASHGQAPAGAGQL